MVPVSCNNVRILYMVSYMYPIMKMPMEVSNKHETYVVVLSQVRRANTHANSTRQINIADHQSHGSPVLQIRTKSKLSWYGHVSTLQTQQHLRVVCIQMSCCKDEVEGKRRRGRPRKMCLVIIKDWAQLSVGDLFD